MSDDIRDLTIIGAGPVGLFGAFYAGMRGASCRVVDALPEAGGQLTALYPEKYVYDVAGLPKVLARDLVRALLQQAAPFAPEYRLGAAVTGLARGDADGRPLFTLRTTAGAYRARALVVAAGIGAFAPRRLPVAGWEGWLGRGLHDRVMDPEDFRGARVLIVGGGDSAFDWAVNLQGVASRILLVHRRDGFRAHAATIAEVERLCAEDRMELRTFREVRAIHGTDRIEAVTLVNTRTREEERVAVDAVLPQLGFVADLGAIAGWGLALEQNAIVVDTNMATSVPGIYAAGDIVTYPGKLKLIAVGFGEVCTAVNNAVHFVHPDRKVFPGHSSNLEVFDRRP